MDCRGSTHKQTFDVVTFTQPKGWQQGEKEGGIALSVIDKKTGAYAIVVITNVKDPNPPGFKN